MIWCMSSLGRISGLAIPWGCPVLGTAESVAAMDRGALLDYQNQHYQPEGLVVSAVGNLKHQQVVDLN
jgi:predicted Zn-dependent peptidase